MSVLVIRRRRGLHVQTTLNYLINEQDGINERVGQNLIIYYIVRAGETKKKVVT